MLSRTVLKAIFGLLLGSICVAGAGLEILIDVREVRLLDRH